MRRALGSALLLGASAFAITFATEARAGDLASIGVGARGMLGASASTGLGPNDVLMAPTGLSTDTLAKAGPSFGGPHGGIGAFAELRLVKVLGVELDYTYTLVTAKGDVPLGAVFPNPTGGMLPTVNVGFQQWQHQFAILGKFVFPSPLIAPFVGAGPEFMLPNGPSITLSPTVSGINFVAHAGNWTALTLVGGVEIKLPLPGVDIRIPIGVRFSYNLSSPDNPAVCGSLNGMQLDASVPADGNCRLKFTGTLNLSQQSLTIDYRTEWKYMIGGQAGIGVYF